MKFSKSNVFKYDSEFFVPLHIDKKILRNGYSKGVRQAFLDQTIPLISSFTRLASSFFINVDMAIYVPEHNGLYIPKGQQKSDGTYQEWFFWEWDGGDAPSRCKIAMKPAEWEKDIEDPGDRVVSYLSGKRANLWFDDETQVLFFGTCTKHEEGAETYFKFFPTAKVVIGWGPHGPAISFLFFDYLI